MGFFNQVLQNWTYCCCCGKLSHVLCTVWKTVLPVCPTHILWQSEQVNLYTRCSPEVMHKFLLCTIVAAATPLVGEEAVDLGLGESHQSVSRAQCMQTQM